MNSVVPAIPAGLPEATSIGLTLPESMTFEQWEAVGAELANRAKKLNWWIGDWWAAGHHRYGERARLAARGLFGKEFKTLANIASVCRAFEPSRRRESLSWSHHAEAAALSPNAADMLLDLAERDRLSKAQIRAAVITIRGRPASRPAVAEEEALAGLYRAYNRLSPELRRRAARAFAAVAENGAELDPLTGSAAPGNVPEAAPEPEWEVASDPARECEAPLELAAEAVIEAEPESAFELELDTVLEPEAGVAFELELDAGMILAPRSDAEEAATPGQAEPWPFR